MSFTTEKNTVAIHQIHFDNKTYQLNFPLRCQLEKEDGVFSITSEMLDIIGTGVNEKDAYQNFCQEFDFIYNRHNDLNDNQLSNRLLNIKKIINLTVKGIL